MKLHKMLLASAAAASGLALAPTPATAQAGTEYIGQISAFGFTFCPRGWGRADGTLLQISQYTALFSILGTTYGGDGRTTFALPDLRGRTPINQGTGPGLPTYREGARGGSTSFQLVTPNLPAHNHTGTIAGSPSAGNTTVPVRNSFAASTGGSNAYITGDPAINNMHPNVLRLNNTGSNVPVNKVSPYLAVQWCVALNGVYPSRS